MKKIKRKGFTKCPHGKYTGKSVKDYPVRDNYIDVRYCKNNCNYKAKCKRWN